MDAAARLADHLIAVRVTQIGTTADMRTEIEQAEGLVWEGHRWYATQAELDTPHTAFRLSPL